MAYDYDDQEPPTYCATCGQMLEPEARFCPNCGAAAGPNAAPNIAPGMAYYEQGGQAGVEYMGFWIRVVAAFIDGILITIVSGILGAILGFDNWWIGTLISLIYHVAFISAKGQTIGKMIFGIQVVNSQGNIPGIGSVLLREVVGKSLSAIALGLGYLWVAWDKDKRGWHDHVGGTYVVRKQRNDTAQQIPYQ